MIAIYIKKDRDAELVSKNMSDVYISQVVGTQSQEKSFSKNTVPSYTQNIAPSDKVSGSETIENSYNLSDSQQNEVKAQVQALMKLDDKTVSNQLRSLQKQDFTYEQKTEIERSLRLIKRKMRDTHMNLETGVDVEALLNDPTSVKTMTEIIRLHKQGRFNQ